MNSVFDAVSLSRLFVIQTDAVKEPGCEVVHVVDDTGVVDLHVIGISINGEVVLVSDTEDICSRCQQLKKEQNRAVRIPSLEVRAFNHGYACQRSDRYFFLTALHALCSSTL